MADNRISDLPSTGALTLDDLLEVEQPAQAAGTRSRKAAIAQLLALIFDDDPTLAGDSDDVAATQAAVKAHVANEIAAAIAGMAGASVGVQFTADTSSTSDADPGAGKLRWNHATQGSATVVYLDDASADGATLTAIWPRLNAGGVMFLQHATDQDIWQIWEFTAINDASGYAKLTVTLWGAAGSFANGDPILVTLDKGQAPAAAVVELVNTPANSSGTVTLDFASASRYIGSITLSANVTTLAFSNLPGSGKFAEYELHIKQDATGGRTFAMPASHKALGGSDTSIASAANAVTVLTGSSVDNGTTWRYAMQESA